MSPAKLNSNMLNVRHLRAFRAVAEHRSMSKAANDVHLSQPAITQAMAKLEQQLGTPLFDRRRDGMVPTEIGADFLVRVQRALDILKVGAKDAARQAGGRGTRGFSQFDQLFTTAQLRAFVAVAKTGNFSLAARDMGVAQPTVHRAARDVERLTGMSCFEKDRQGISMTAAGDALVRAIKLAFVELDQGCAEIRAALGSDSATIIVGTTPLPRSYLLPKAIAELTATAPDIVVSVVDGPYGDLLQGLRHGELDFLIGALRNPLPIDDVVQEALLSDPLIVAARTGHPLTEKAEISVADLARYPWAVPRKGTPTRDSFEQIFDQVEPPQGLVESSSLILIRELLQASNRLTLISAHQIRHELHLGLLVPIPMALSGTSRPIGLTTRKNWHPTQTQQRLLENLRQAAEAA